MHSQGITTAKFEARTPLSGRLYILDQVRTMYKKLERPLFVIALGIIHHQTGPVFRPRMAQGHTLKQQQAGFFLQLDSVRTVEGTCPTPRPMTH
jgi:hypothetical protein